MAEPIKGPLFDVLIKTEVKKEDAVNDAADLAVSIPIDELALMSGDQVVDEILWRGLRGSIPGVKRQLRVTREGLGAEMAATKLQDPRTVPAIRSADVAAERSRQIQGAEPTAGEKEEPSDGEPEDHDGHKH